MRFAGTLVGFEFEINLDHVVYTRAIYGFWDFLADVGGLFDMLKIIVYPITVLFTTLFRTGLNQYIFSALFQIEKSRKKDRKIKSGDVNMQIKHRKPAAISFCKRICSKKSKKLYQKAQNRTSYELDIANFLQTQMVARISLRMLFTKFERFLLRNQHKPFALRVDSHDDSDSNDWKPS